MARPSPSLPSELVDKILLNLACPPHTPPTAVARAENASHTNLCNASLVSKQWKDSARRALFGSLNMSWRESTAPQLLQTFAANPHLFTVVRHLAVCYTSPEVWKTEWRDSAEAREKEDEAAKLFPKGIPPPGTDERTIGHDEMQRCGDYLAFMYKAGDAPLRQARKREKWLGSERRQGSDKLWELVAKFKNLRTLEARGLDQPIGDNLLLSLKPVLSKLTEVSLSSDRFNAPITPYLESVETLYISEFDFEAPSPTSTPTGNLKHLRLGRLDNCPLAHLGLDLTQLVVLDLPSICQVAFLEIANLLPTLKDLAVFRIHSQMNEETRQPSKIWDDLFTSLQPLPLTHLYLDTVPLKAQLYCLPSTIKVLDIGFSGWDSLVDELTSVDAWNDLHDEPLAEVTLVRPWNPWNRLFPGAEEAEVDMVEQSPAYKLQFRFRMDAPLSEVPGPWSGRDFS